MTAPIVVAVGECMLELVRRPDGLLQTGYAGDVFNTAVYLKRHAPQATVGFASAIGRDELSDGLAEAVRAEGIHTEHLWRHPDRTIGLYLVHTDDDGERSFTYYRDSSAARECFSAHYPAEVDEGIAAADLVYLSGITLSILRPEARSRLLAALRRTRANGGRIAFDSNYRPRGWACRDDARTAVAEVLPLVTIALPSMDDEIQLWGDHSVEECGRRYLDAGADEVIVKQGASEVTICKPGGKRGELHALATRRVERVVDTTGAGDSFNGAYLAARLAGASASDAVAAGSACAATVIGHRGAIVPMESSSRSPNARPR
ncbi:sugar kinase [Microtetraspora malaysiensis]|uniref:Sugar kinase n=1 Tax=Microtetraspora malaysiensis TaxID=161358 RepID=A0ABW6SPZ3_9ACTN